jgi:hypothetical protein
MFVLTEVFSAVLKQMVYAPTVKLMAASRVIVRFCPTIILTA